MAELSRRLTLQRFGRTIRLYAPLYLSSYCVNRCQYCGFNRDNAFDRVRLSIEEAVAEAELLAREGFRDILLVTSEDRKFITVPYLTELAKALRGKFSFIGAEIYQMTASDYRQALRRRHRGSHALPGDVRPPDLCPVPPRRAEGGLRHAAARSGRLRLGGYAGDRPRRTAGIGRLAD